MSRIKTPAYYRAKGIEKLYFVSGIPERFWEYDESNIKFSSFSYEGDKAVKSISLQEQNLYWASIFDSKPRSDIICISSSPTDTMALAAASTVAKGAIERRLCVDMMDLGSPYKLDKSPDILILHNLTELSTYDRFQSTRDWLYRFDGAFRIVVVATDNPILFVKKQLRMDVDQILFSRHPFISKVVAT